MEHKDILAAAEKSWDLHGHSQGLALYNLGFCEGVQWYASSVSTAVSTPAPAATPGKTAVKFVYEWVNKHGTAPAFHRELLAFAKWMQERH